MLGDALAQRQVDPVGVVDEEPQRLGAGLLEGDHLDLGLELGESLFDFLLQFRHRLGRFFLRSRAKKRWARAHLSKGVRVLGRSWASIAAAPCLDTRAGAGRTRASLLLEQQRHRAVVDQLDRHPGAEPPALGAEALAEALVEGLGQLRGARRRSSGRFPFRVSA